MYVYNKVEESFEVGYWGTDSVFRTESKFDSAQDAAARVHYLHGGSLGGEDRHKALRAVIKMARLALLHLENPETDPGTAPLILRKMISIAEGAISWPPVRL